MSNIIEQRSNAWFEERLGKATASRFNDIMATIKSGYSSSRKNYRAQLVIERLTQERVESYTSPVLQWGIDNEPTARLAFEAETGLTVIDAPYVPHVLLEAGASPDGFIGEDGVLEIKCPNSATHITTLASRKIPYQYIAQVQGQMWITGRQWAKFVSFDPRMPMNAQMIIIDVPRDDEYIARLEKEVGSFLEEVEAETEFVQEYK